MATAYLFGVSTRRVEKLAESLGVAQLSKSQVSAMARHLDEQVTAFRNRPLDAGPYAFAWVDALTQKVREGGRTINVHALIAVGVNADGHHEILGLDVATAEDGAGWLAFLRSLIARGLTGVRRMPGLLRQRSPGIRRKESARIFSGHRALCGLERLFDTSGTTVRIKASERVSKGHVLGCMEFKSDS